MSESEEHVTDEETWHGECRIRVADYLKDQGVVHGRIGDAPAWSVPCVMSVWAVESVRAPGWVGWWVLCGDGPTDYVSSKDSLTPREAVRAVAQRWREACAYLARGEAPPHFQLGSSDSRPQLAPLLESRAELLLQWVADDAIWSEE
jgi:hypothetical protein